MSRHLPGDCQLQCAEEQIAARGQEHLPGGGAHRAGRQHEESAGRQGQRALWQRDRLLARHPRRVHHHPHLVLRARPPDRCQAPLHTVTATMLPQHRARSTTPQRHAAAPHLPGRLRVIAGTISRLIR